MSCGFTSASSASRVIGVPSTVATVSARTVPVATASAATATMLNGYMEPPWWWSGGYDGLARTPQVGHQSAFCNQENPVIPAAADVAAGLRAARGRSARGLCTQSDDARRQPEEVLRAAGEDRRPGVPAARL